MDMSKTKQLALPSSSTFNSSNDEKACKIPVLTIVVPCYNEEDVLPVTAGRLLSILSDLVDSGELDPQSSVYFVDDGSQDRTWHFIKELSAQDCRFHGIRLPRNHGHQNALLAGLLTVPGDAVISIDADLQDDVATIPEMVRAHRGGAEIVYGVRRGRQSDTLFKRTTARIYYTLLTLFGVQIINNHADFRLMGRTSIQALAEYHESNLFLRGLIPQLGFNTACVYYDRRQRAAGESKYPLVKMLALAINGITSFSAVPLRLITVLGFAVCLITIGIAAWALWAKIYGRAVVPGWTSIVLPMYLLGGIQLFCVGIVGQYLSKIYLETKRRPRFTIERII